VPEEASAARGTLSRGTANRFGSPVEATLVASPIFLGDDYVPGALGDALETQKRFEGAARDGDVALARLLATRLLRTRDFLRAAQERAERASDGALLVTNVARAFGEGGSHAVWAPARVPPGYPARPQRLHQIPPFDPSNVREWTEVRDGESGFVAVRDAGPPQAVEAKGIIECFNRTLSALDALPKGAPRESGSPIVDAARANLASLTLADVTKQTRVALSSAVESPLLQQTEVILFHGASFSVVLDRHGEPTTLRRGSGGVLYYPILVGEPGHPIRRQVPSPGTYISLQKYGFSTFRVRGRAVSKVLFGGVGGFDENFDGGVVDRHDVHKRIQSYLDSLGRFVYVAGVAVPSASNPRELTSASIADEVPKLAARAVPFAVAEVERRLRAQGFGESLEGVGREAVQQLIVEMVRTRIRDYVGRKIGTKFVPFVNLAFTIVDIAEGEEDRRRVRTAVAALLMGLRGRTEDEQTIAAKVLGQIMGDQVQSQVVQMLLGAGKLAASRRKHDGTPESGPRMEKHPPIEEPQVSPPISVPTESTPMPPATAPGRVRGSFDDPRSVVPVAAPAAPSLSPGITASGPAKPPTDRPLQPHFPHIDQAKAHEVAPGDRAIPDRRGNEPASPEAPTVRERSLAEPSPSQSPGAHTSRLERADALRHGPGEGDERRTRRPPAGTPAPTETGLTRATPMHTVVGSAGEKASVPSTPRNAGDSSHATDESAGAITLVGVDRVRGVPESEPEGATARGGVEGAAEPAPTPSPHTTRRALDQRTPESGTPMGFQTQIGPEIATRIGRPGHEVGVTSRHPHILISADVKHHRDDVRLIIGRDPEHPLRRIYDEGTQDFRQPPYRGRKKTLADYEQHPYDWEAGHMRSKSTGDPDVIVFQTRFRNQKQSAEHEKRRVDWQGDTQTFYTGNITKDEVVVIGGIAVEKMSAWDLFDHGLLDLPPGQTPDDLPPLKL
jgi:hypothetical protein